MKRFIFGLLLLAGPAVGCRELTATTHDRADETTDSEHGEATDMDAYADTCANDLADVCGDGPVRTAALTDAYNFQFSAALHATSVEVKSLPVPDMQNLTFDWSGLTHSIMNEDIDPATDVDMLILSVWRYSQTDLEEAFINDRLYAEFRLGALCTETDGIATAADVMSSGWCYVDDLVVDHIDGVAPYLDGSDPNYDPSAITHVALVKSGTHLDGALNIQMLKFVTLNPASDNTTVALDNDSASLEWRANLHTPKRIPVTDGDPNIEVRWEDVTVNGLGNKFVQTQITRIVVAHYPMTVCTLEDNFIHLDTLQDAWYEKIFKEPTYSIRLSELTDATETPFPGITADGTWIVALFCDMCNLPIPWFITVLQPC